MFYKLLFYYLTYSIGYDEREKNIINRIKDMGIEVEMLLNSDLGINEDNSELYFYPHDSHPKPKAALLFAERLRDLIDSGKIKLAQ